MTCIRGLVSALFLLEVFTSVHAQQSGNAFPEPSAGFKPKGAYPVDSRL